MLESVQESSFSEQQPTTVLGPLLCSSNYKNALPTVSSPGSTARVAMMEGFKAAETPSLTPSNCIQLWPPKDLLQTAADGYSLPELYH